MILPAFQPNYIYYPWLTPYPDFISFYWKVLKNQQLTKHFYDITGGE